MTGPSEESPPVSPTPAERPPGPQVVVPATPVTVPCVGCLQPIPKGAKRCHLCQEYQDWFRQYGVTILTVVLGVLTIISFFDAIRTRVTPKNSEFTAWLADVRLMQPMKAGETPETVVFDETVPAAVYAVVGISNSGTGDGTLQRVAIHGSTAPCQPALIDAKTNQPLQLPLTLKAGETALLLVGVGSARTAVIKRLSDDGIDRLVTDHAPFEETFECRSFMQGHSLVEGINLTFGDVDLLLVSHRGTQQPRTVVTAAPNVVDGIKHFREVVRTLPVKPPQSSPVVVPNLRPEEPDTFEPYDRNRPTDGASGTRTFESERVPDPGDA